jgi:glycosyltransferase involved in cell wall biosynthesis
MRISHESNAYLNPRGLHHVGGVGVWARGVKPYLVNQGQIPLIQTFGSESKNHLLTRFSEQILLPLKLRDTDLLISLCNWGPILENQVIVIHDIAPLVRPEFFDPNYVKFAKIIIPKLVKKVRQIATVSEFSRQEISRYFNYDYSKIKVLGAGTSFAQIEINETYSPTPFTNIINGYCVFLGGHDKRKNLKFLIDLWPEIYAASGKQLLVTTVENPALAKNMQNQDTSGIIYVGHVENRQMRSLVQNASMLLNPSIYEGYGMPVIEALSLGTAVISSETGIVRDIKTSGLTVLPLDRELWINSILARPSSDFEFKPDSWRQVSQNLIDCINEFN